MVKSFPFSALTLVVGQWVLVCWWSRFDYSLECCVAPVATTTSIILSSNIEQRSRMETFWYRLTQVHLEKWQLKHREIGWDRGWDGMRQDR